MPKLVRFPTIMGHQTNYQGILRGVISIQIICYYLQNKVLFLQKYNLRCSDKSYLVQDLSNSYMCEHVFTLIFVLGIKTMRQICHCIFRFTSPQDTSFQNLINMETIPHFADTCTRPMIRWDGGEKLFRCSGFGSRNQSIFSCQFQNQFGWQSC